MKSCLCVVHLSHDKQNICISFFFLKLDFSLPLLVTFISIAGYLLYGSNMYRGRQHSFVEIDHEIFSTVILSLPLIQEGQLSVSGERMCTILVNRLED